MLPWQIFHCSRRLQHLHVQGQWPEERVCLHSHVLPCMDGPHREMHALQHLPCRRRPEHLRLPSRWQEEPGALHALGVSSSG